VFCGVWLGVRSVIVVDGTRVPGAEQASRLFLLCKSARLGDAVRGLRCGLEVSG